MKNKTTQELLSLMAGGTMAEIKAANAEYWGRVESGEHPRPAPIVEFAPVETPSAFHARVMSKI